MPSSTTRSLDHEHGIYTDNGATFVTASGNVLFGNHDDWGSRHTDFGPGATGSDPTVIENNYWQQGDQDSSSNNATVAGNLIVSSLDQVPLEILANAGLEPTFRHILARRFTLPTAPDAPALVTAFGANTSAYVAWNPTFVDHGPPGMVPAAPTSVSVRPGQDAVTLHWHPPASVGGTPIVGYTISGGVVNGPDIPTTMYTGHQALWANSTRDVFTTIGGLQQLTPYTFQIAAVNVSGASVAVSTDTVILAPTKACAGATLAAIPRAALALPGSTATVSATLANGCTTTLHAARLLLFAPQGYGVAPPSPADLGDIVVGQSATRTFAISVPADATSSVDLITQAVFTDDAGQLQGLRTRSTVNVPAASLAAAFNNVGTTTDTNTGAGDIDGSGSSFSAQALAAAGVTPGATVTTRGISFVWPNVPTGQPDNAVASGQAFLLAGTGATLGFLVTATYGSASGTGQVVYTDGTTQPFTIGAPDWFSGGNTSSPLRSVSNVPVHCGA